MEQLPPEIILQFFRFLNASEIVNLQLVCRRLYTISRDNELWKTQCFETSSWESLRRRRELLRRRRELGPSGSDTIPGEPGLGDLLSLSGIDGPNPPIAHNLNLVTKANERTRILANWDPSYPGETIDWYSDYVHRNGPITVSWLQQPRNRESSDHEPMDVRGSGVYNAPGEDDSSIAVAPLDDGSICLWDLSGTSGRKGRIMGRSASRSLLPSGVSRSGAALPRTINTGVTECVSIDSIRRRAYIAVQCEYVTENVFFVVPPNARLYGVKQADRMEDLIEVDLETLQVISQEKFPYHISALSEGKGANPITVGTNRSLHINDPRANSLHGTGSDELHNVLHPPLSIINVPSQSNSNGDDGDIYVAGRFPSILNYDRRWFPRLRRTIYSGARLCSLALIPSYSLACANDRERMRRGELSTERMETIKAQTGHTLIAGGEYNSKGSLEFYGLDSQPRPRSAMPVSFPSDDNLHVLKNRQTSSSSKLLSVSNHGALIVFSDGRGSLKWFERDGVTGVREWNISHGRREATLGIFGMLGGSYLDSSSGEIVRKISHSHTGDTPRKVNADDLVLWTGDKIGLLSFSSKPGFTAESFDESAKTAEQAHREREERVYGETMRRALERQADEVRFVRGLGLGMRGDL